MRGHIFVFTEITVPYYSYKSWGIKVVILVKNKTLKKPPKNITMDGVLRVKTICVTLVLWISACVLVFADVGLIPGPIVTKAQCRAKCLQEVYNYWCSYSLFDQIYPFSNLYKITYSVPRNLKQGLISHIIIYLNLRTPDSSKKLILIISP